MFKADDKSTSTITDYLYQNLANGEPKHLALYHSKQKYLSNCKTSDEASPVYWAGLQLLGDTSPLSFGEGQGVRTKHNYLLFGSIIGGFSFLILLLYFLKRKS